MGRTPSREPCLSAWFGKNQEIIRLFRQAICALLVCIWLVAVPTVQAETALSAQKNAAAVTTANPVSYRMLTKGASGEDVLRLKRHMQELGFFNADAVLTDSYNSTMEYKVKQYENALGEKATGIATPELQALIFSKGGGLPAVEPSTVPAQTPTTAPAKPSVPLATPAPVPTATPVQKEAVTTLDGTGYRTLQEGMSGDDVLRLKQKMQAMGFFMQMRN